MQFHLYTEFPEALRGEWNALLAESYTDVPFLRFEYQQAWWSLRGGGEWSPESRLCILTARRDQQLVGIAPLFWIPAAENRPSHLALIGATSISDYLDLIVRPADADEFIRELLQYLRSTPPQPFDLVRLDNILHTSTTLSILAAAAPHLGWALATETLEHSPIIHLPGDWEIYLASIDKKQRHEIRRKMRRLEESEHAVRWYTVTDPAELPSAGTAFFELMAQDEEKKSFLTPAMREQMTRIMASAFEGGYLRLVFLEIDGQKAAAYWNFDYLNRIWVYNSGMNRELMEYSPGWVLLGNLLRQANEEKREAFDFMRGTEEYKYRFGAEDRFVLRADLTPAS